MTRLSSIGWQLPADLYAQSGVRGCYNPLNCVVDLHPDLQRALEQAGPGFHSSRSAGGKAIDAQSTYLHEMIHWWQHVGTTSGFVQSLCYPAQSHLNYSRLRELLAAFPPVKSLRQLDLGPQRELSESVRKTLNIVLNNWHDVQYCRFLMLEPERAEDVIRDRYFESVGHSYEMTWASVLWLISSVADPDFSVLQDPRTWESAFDDLRKNKVQNFAYGEAVHLPPIGTAALFEGQARFSQLQFLARAHGIDTWEPFERAGMLEGVYVSAFTGMLRGLHEFWPTSPRSPLVGLFLLLCDLAINPTEGFPLQLTFPETFLLDTDPGTRFVRLCWLVRDRFPTMKTAVTRFSRDEYIALSEELCRAALWPSPMTAAREVSSWPVRSAGFASLSAEHATWKFQETNLPIRLFVARFLQMQADRASAPEFFAWPGVWTSPAAEQGGSGADPQLLLNRHVPLFLRHPSGEVRPTMLPGHGAERLYEVANAFLSWNALYELISQWHVEAGPFSFDLDGFGKHNSPRDIEKGLSDLFEYHFGLPPHVFNIL